MPVIGRSGCDGKAGELSVLTFGSGLYLSGECWRGCFLQTGAAMLKADFA